MITFERLDGTADMDSMYVDPSIEAFPAPLQLHMPMPPVTAVPFAKQSTANLILQTRAHMGSVRLFHCFPTIPSYFFHDTPPYLRFYEKAPHPPTTSATLLELIGGEAAMAAFRALLEKSQHTSPLICKYFFFWAMRYWLLVRGFFLQLRTASAEMYLDAFLPCLAIILPNQIQAKADATALTLNLATTTDAELQVAARDHSLCTFASEVMCRGYTHLVPKAQMQPWRKWASDMCNSPSTLFPSCRFREVYTDAQRFARTTVHTKAHRLAKVHASAEAEPLFFTHMSFSPRHPILVESDWHPDYMAWQLLFYASFEEMTYMTQHCEYLKRLMVKAQRRDGRVLLMDGQEKVERFPREFARHRFSFFFSPHANDTRAYLYIPALICSGTSRLPDESDVRFLTDEAWEWAAAAPRPCLSLSEAWHRALDEGRFRVGTELSLAPGEFRVCSNLILKVKSSTTPFNEWQQRLLTRAWTDMHTLPLNCYYYMYIVQLITGSERMGIASVVAKGFSRQQVCRAYLDHERSIDSTRTQSPLLHAHSRKCDIPTAHIDPALAPLMPSWMIARALQWLRPASLLLVNRPRFTETPGKPCSWLEYFEEEVPLYVARSAMRDLAIKLLSADTWPHLVASSGAQCMRPEIRALGTWILPTTVLPPQYRFEVYNVLGAPLDVSNTVEDQCARMIEFERFFHPGREIGVDTYQRVMSKIVQAAPHLAGAIARMYSLAIRVDGISSPTPVAHIPTPSVSVASVLGSPPPVQLPQPQPAVEETLHSPMQDAFGCPEDPAFVVDAVTLSKFCAPIPGGLHLVSTEEEAKEEEERKQNAQG